jgi:hypothetical protein
MAFHVPEEYRIREGEMASVASFGNNGAFRLKLSGGDGRWAVAIASDGMSWEHVSVTIGSKQFSQGLPTWAEMCEVKSLFWDREDCVVQLHPPASLYVNQHPGCLHLWRPIGREIPLPPKECV